MSTVIAYLAALPNAIGAADLGGGAYRIDFQGGTSRAATGPEILTAGKSAKLTAINGECARRILASYPDWMQRNLAMGVDSGDAVEARRAACVAWINACRDASNGAADTVDAMTDPAVVSAYDERTAPTWP